MANTDAPFGFKAIGGMGSSYETQGTSKYEIADNSTYRFFKVTFVNSVIALQAQPMQMVSQ